MYQEERLMAILRYLEQHERIGVQDIVEQFKVSRDTARRDILKLEEQGSIVRTRGGAILPGSARQIRSYQERLQLESEGKRAIGMLGARFIQDRESVMMDASTTVRFAAEKMESKDNVVITNSIDIAAVLADKGNVSVKLLGGDLDLENRYVYGPRAVQMLSDFHVNKLFIGACGITVHGLFSWSEEDGLILREMMRRADAIYVLADHSKFGVQLLYRVAGLERIDVVITDEEPAEEIQDALRANNVDWIQATKHLAKEDATE
ncbi:MULTISPECIES: DeoR/GlpR family DNA-binding transcription regulator [Brevibacillus]|nr:DeoR/GlpR family DNA-binding transcription regulator [Brevibacillus borstelensis]KKX54064.1 DeoR faimly transcriptional regulator [Brevibacillus borstelensis cifa_chp40]MBE5398092.1 DeoR/GlpR transcriptional regulator [Brevibacillus borstelensis]MCC0564665.1 DeoR/GlpR family DNA-binding transcription regulator [Brevibacillus borstelensis]MED1852448.1 DeoR/GlpR family DNA-binding transcription regulator [Brevibacillus borstelensis]MED1876169.1 DeoR/GlpR family DNA-binding transcription regul